MIGARAQELRRSCLKSGLLHRSCRASFRSAVPLGAGVERIQDTSHLNAHQPSTQIGKGSAAVADEAATLPIGAVVLMSDGADNSGGIDLDTLPRFGAGSIAGQYGWISAVSSSPTTSNWKDCRCPGKSARRLALASADRVPAKRISSGKCARTLLTTDGQYSGQPRLILNGSNGTGRDAGV